MTNKNFVPLEESQKNKKPFLEYNNKTEQSYIKNNFETPEYLDYQEKNFLSKVDVENYPIERTVTKIVRTRAQDNTSKKKEYKEFLVWYENWYGKDWMGRKVPPVADHVEGVYNEQEKEPVVEKMKIVGYQRSGQNTIYYVPFSKSKVDEIVNSSMGTYRENIVYCVKNGPEMRNDRFSYDQFVNLKFEECVDLMLKPGGPSKYPYDKTRQQYS